MRNGQGPGPADYRVGATLCGRPGVKQDRSALGRPHWVAPTGEPEHTDWPRLRLRAHSERTYAAGFRREPCTAARR